MESDAAGHVYATNYEQNAILRRKPYGLSASGSTPDPVLLR